MLTVERPKLTLPDAEADWLRAAYSRADCVLEYGSGGSTVMAAELGVGCVQSVESDPDWAAGMTEWFAANPAKGDVRVIHADVGPTGKWGTPVNNAGWRRYAAYALGVWERDDFVQPDVVLIDGRFRAGCFLATLFRTARPVDVYFDDYTNRPEYHVVETFAEKAGERGRMAHFRVTPTAVPGDRLLEIITIFQLKK